MRIVAIGGIGTRLEFFYSRQLVQVTSSIYPPSVHADRARLEHVWVNYEKYRVEFTGR